MQNNASIPGTKYKQGGFFFNYISVPYYVWLECEDIFTSKSTGTLLQNNNLYFLLSAILQDNDFSVSFFLLK